MMSCEKVINIGIFVALEAFRKKHKDVSRTIATAKMETFSELVSTFQPLNNFTKNPIIGACISRILKLILKFMQMIKYSNAELQPATFLKNNLFHRLVNYLNSLSDRMYISYPIS